MASSGSPGQKGASGMNGSAGASGVGGGQPGKTGMKGGAGLAGGQGGPGYKGGQGAPAARGGQPPAVVSMSLGESSRSIPARSEATPRRAGQEDRAAQGAPGEPAAREAVQAREARAGPVAMPVSRSSILIARAWAEDCLEIIRTRRQINMEAAGRAPRVPMEVAARPVVKEAAVATVAKVAAAEVRRGVACMWGRGRLPSQPHRSKTIRRSPDMEAGEAREARGVRAAVVGPAGVAARGSWRAR